jgi:hypothetical protein
VGAVVSDFEAVVGALVEVEGGAVAGVVVSCEGKEGER